MAIAAAIALTVLVGGGAAAAGILLLDRAPEQSSGTAAPSPSAPSDPFNNPAVAGKTVVLEILGSGTTDIRFKEGLTYDQTLWAEPLPWRHDFISRPDSSGVFITVNGADSDIVCRIEIDGAEVRHEPPCTARYAAPLTE